MIVREFKELNCINIRVEESERIPEERLDHQAGHIRIEIASSNKENRDLLNRHQYIMVDRTIRAKIALAALQGMAKYIRVETRQLEDLSEEIFEVAKQAFQSDRRFFLTLECDKKAGHQVLYEYIMQYKEKEKMVCGCFYEDKLIAAWIAVKISDTEYETVLGAVLPEWQSKGAGVGLYAFAFNRLKEQGVKTLYSRISTDNIASLNLHVSLCSGKLTFAEPLDVYIRG